MTSMRKPISEQNSKINSQRIKNNLIEEKMKREISVLLSALGDCKSEVSNDVSVSLDDSESYRGPPSNQEYMA